MVRKLSMIALLSALATLPAMAADRDATDDRADANRRSAGEFIDDATITTKVKSAFVNDDKVSALDVKVNTQRGIVQLSGFADSRDTIRRAEELARSVGGVRDVKNDIQMRK